MHKPAEAAFHDPAAREHDKAFLSWVTFDHTMAHAVPVRPLVTGCSREGPVQDRLPQAGPRRLAWIKSLKRVAILHRGGDDRDGQPGAIGINQGHALAPEHLLSGIVPTWPPHRDALDRLRIDDAQARLGPAAHRAAAAAGHIAQQAVEQPLLQPFAKPTVYGAPGRPAWRQRPPWAADAQVPGDRAHNCPIGRCPPAARWVHTLQPSRHLRDGVQRHDLFQARVIPRPMRLGPHLSLSQTTKITVGSDRDQPNRPTQTGSYRLAPVLGHGTRLFYELLSCGEPFRRMGRGGWPAMRSLQQWMASLWAGGRIFFSRYKP